MAGHSQFKNIMHRKGAQDAKRAKTFAKLAREITVAAKLGTPDPKQNPRLRSAMINARSENMPNDRISKAIQKAESNDNDKNYEEIRYEGYAVGGVALIIDALTDNRNRTASEVRAILNKYGGSLAETGAVAFNFERIGVIEYKYIDINSDLLFDVVVESGAIDLIKENEFHKISCKPEELGKVRDYIAEKFNDPKTAKLQWKANNTIEINEEHAKTLLKMIELLEDNDDVQSIYSNFEISMKILEKISI